MYHIPVRLVNRGKEGVCEGGRGREGTGEGWKE